MSPTSTYEAPVTEDKNAKGAALEDFPLKAHDKIRYNDTDRQGHVNNAAFSTFLETGRTEILNSPDAPLNDKGASSMIARLEISYEAEITWPGRVDIGTGVLKVGNSSVTFFQGVFQNGRRCAAAETVIVQTDDETRRPRPLSPGAKAFLEAHKI